MYKFFKKGLLSLFSLLLLSGGVFAQTDSATFVNAQWLKRNISKGVTLKQFHFTNNSLFCSNQFISILKIDPTYAKIDIVADTILRTVSDFASQYSVLAAINGSFFDMAASGKPYNSVDYLRIDGVELAPNQYKDNARLFHQTGAVALFNGEFYLLKADEVKDWESYIEAEDVLTSGPLLRIDGNDEVLAQNSFNVSRHPRTCVAKSSPCEIFFIVVDGRNAAAAGVSLSELQQIVRWLGAKDALNLDGGGSSTMFVEGKEKDEQVVNHPSDNKLFDHQGERRVANALIVTRKTP